MTHDVVLAHSTAAAALPFVVSALLVIGLLVAIAWRDRRKGDE